MDAYMLNTPLPSDATWQYNIMWTNGDLLSSIATETNFSGILKFEVPIFRK